MQTDPLQQLRDVHTPPDPGWWPLAPGWWLLAVATLLAIYVLGRYLAAWLRNRRPIKLAKAEFVQLNKALADDTLSLSDYVHRCNALLKRLYVHGLHRPDYADLSGRAWLGALDREAGNHTFTQGVGRALGSARFAADFSAKFAPQLPQFQEAVSTLLARTAVKAAQPAATNPLPTSAQEASQ